MAARASLVAPVVSPHFISTVIRASGSLNSQAGLMPLPSAQAQALQWRAVRDIVLARDSRICRACGDTCSQGEADVHHLIPRAAGGVDDPANLITLCDGCHAAHHPNLQGTLARRTIERWGLRLARWLDHRHELADVDESLGAAMRLLGVTRLRTHQLEVILAALRGESLLLVSATGSGKSLCFQVPVLLSRGCGLVISPLKALMSQQVADLQTKKVPGTFINGDLGPQEKGIRYQLLRDRAIKFLYCTPERFDPGMVREAEVEEIARARPAYLVIDEAHCIDRWGKDFRPNYDKLGAVRRALGNPPLLAFTDRKSTRLNSSHVEISYAVFCLKKKKYKASRPAHGSRFATHRRRRRRADQRVGTRRALLDCQRPLRGPSLDGYHDQHPSPSRYL